jgi:hypothetical protein
MLPNPLASWIVIQLEAATRQAKELGAIARFAKRNPGAWPALNEIGPK